MDNYDSHVIELLEHYKKAVDMSTILSISDLKGNIIYANDHFCEISGYSLDEIIGKPHSIVRHPDMTKEVFENLWKTIKNKQVWKGIIKNRAKDGSTYIVQATIIPIVDKHGHIKEYVGIRHNITEEYSRRGVLELDINEQKKLIENLKKIDASTGLPNQSSLLDTLEDKKDSLLSVIGIKIDNLKSIKDILGDDFAETYIIELADMLSRYTRHTFGCLGIFRIYFDEIVILFDGHQELYKKLAYEFSHISKYFVTTHKEVSIGSLFTIVLFSDTGEIYEKTLAALLYGFEHHRGEVYLVEQTSSCFEDKFPSNVFWLTKYSKAIENDEMLPFYQPILNNKTGIIEKFECLARIKDSDDFISPDKFINLASSAKQLPFLTKAIVRKAFEHFSNKNEFEFSINVSAMDLQDKELLKLMLYWQEKTNIDPSRVVLEILETEDIYKYKILKSSIEQFKKEGFKIAIDDFGTGYSNFIALYEYNVDFIKIDGSFIKNLDTDESMKDLVAHLHHLIRMCGAKSIAEFVRNDKIQEIVKEIGVDYSQGYAIGKPRISV